MDSESLPTLSEIEDFLYKYYIEHKDSHLEFSTDDFTKIEHKIDFLKLKLLSDNLPFILDKVETRKSQIHGLGVFAKKFIRKGELITFYPGDIVKFAPNGDKNIQMHSALIFPSERVKDPTDKDNNYAFSIDDYYTIIGDKLSINNSSYLGHMINDRSKCPKDKKYFHNYIEFSKKYCNCYFKVFKGGLHVAIIATKNIKPDQELFIPYGINYCW